MTELSASPQAETSFAAILTPHRSLGPKGFAVLMGAVCIVSFSTGLLFYLIGAWPVVGFMGLDVLGSLYLGAHRASSFASANRLHTNDSGLLTRLDAAFVSDVPAALGYGF